MVYQVAPYPVDIYNSVYTKPVHMKSSLLYIVRLTRQQRVCMTSQ